MLVIDAHDRVSSELALSHEFFEGLVGTGDISANHDYNDVGSEVDVEVKQDLPSEMQDKMTMT
jgi:hypothetical protein